MEISRAFNLYMEYCRSKQLRQRTMLSYEQTIKLFIRWLKEVEGIDQIEQIKEVTIRHEVKPMAYIRDAFEKAIVYETMMDDLSQRKVVVDLQKEVFCDRMTVEEFETHGSGRVKLFEIRAY